MMKTLLWTLIFICGQVWAQQGNVSNIYEQKIHQEKHSNLPILSSKQKEDITQKYKILFVPGVLGDIYMQTGLLEYFHEHIRWLEKDLGLKKDINFEIVPINTQAPLRESIPVVANSIAKSDRPVIIISHSMGGLNSFYTLIENPELQDKVAGLVTIQTPFRGSHVADQIADSYCLKNLSWLFLKSVGGSLETLMDLTSKVREEKLNEVIAGKKLQDLLKKVVLLNVASSVSDKDSQGFHDLNSLITTLPFIGGLNPNSVPNDGLVSIKSAIIHPDIDHIIIDGIDHIDPISPNFSVTKEKNFNRIDFFKTLLSLILESVAINKI